MPPRRRNKDMLRLFIVSRMRFGVRGEFHLTPMLVGDTSDSSMRFVSIQMKNLVSRIYNFEQDNPAQLGRNYSNFYGLGLLVRFSWVQWSRYIIEAIERHPGADRILFSFAQRKREVPIAPIPTVKPFFKITYVSPYEPVPIGELIHVRREDLKLQFERQSNHNLRHDQRQRGTIRHPINIYYYFGEDGVDLGFKYLSTLFRDIYKLFIRYFIPQESGLYPFEGTEREDIYYPRRRRGGRYRRAQRSQGNLVNATSTLDVGTPYGVYGRQRLPFGPRITQGSPDNDPRLLWFSRIKLLEIGSEEAIVNSGFRLNPFASFIEGLERIIEAYLEQVNARSGGQEMHVIGGIEFSFVYLPNLLRHRRIGNTIRPFRGFLNLRGYKYIHIQSRTKCLPKSILAIIKLLRMQKQRGAIGKNTRRTCTKQCFFRSIENIISRAPLSEFDFHLNSIEEGIKFLYNKNRIPEEFPILVYAPNGALCLWAWIEEDTQRNCVEARIKVRDADEEEPKFPEPHIALIVAGNHCMPMYKETWFDPEILEVIPETSSRGEKKIYKLEEPEETVTEIYFPPMADEVMVDQGIKASNLIIKTKPKYEHQRLYLPHLRKETKPDFNKVLVLDIETTKCPTTGRVITFLLELLGKFPKECFHENPLLGPSPEDKDPDDDYYHWLVEGYTCCEILASFLVRNMRHLNGFTIITYNGARFDVYPVLLELLYLTQEREDSIFIDRMIYQTGFTSLSLQKWITEDKKKKLLAIHFRDLYKFTIGMSLKQACIAYKTKIMKGDIQHDEVTLENWKDFFT